MNYIEYKIPDGMDTKLVNLIINTESMDNIEKQYWFDIFPSMNKQQVDRLFEILETERINLEEIERINQSIN